MIVIGTRGSKLALWQANHIRDQLQTYFPDLEVHIQIIKTTGDRLQAAVAADISSHASTGISAKGAFSKEIDQAQLEAKIDVAVHSLKDLPTDLPVGLTLGAIPIREDARDMLISKNGTGLADLRSGEKVGTRSLRRQTQLHYHRPDLKVVGLRGNVDTRIRRLHETDLSAIVLATAGLNRLFGSPPTLPHLELTPIPVDQMVPAVGQGALAVVARTDDVQTLDLLKRIDHSISRTEVVAERAALSTMANETELGAGCQIPIGIYAKYTLARLQMVGVICSEKGLNRVCVEGSIDDPISVGRQLGQQLLTGTFN